MSELSRCVTWPLLLKWIDIQALPNVVKSYGVSEGICQKNYIGNRFTK